MLWRAKELKFRVRLSPKPFHQVGGQSRLADARLTGQQRYTSISAFCVGP
jgi:hypothetical protein